MIPLTIIGDVHEHINDLIPMIKDEHREYGKSRMNFICVGDLGFDRCISRLREELFLYSEHFYSVVGNHDDIHTKDRWPYLGDYCYFPWHNLFTVRGALSIDKHKRTEGIDWFANEELTYSEGLEAFDLYAKVKPKVVVSHDCPQSVMEQLFGYTDKSSTRQLLQAMLEEHQPNWWFFGHHHKSKDELINGTRFICLNELETFTLNV